MNEPTIADTYDFARSKNVKSLVAASREYSWRFKKSVISEKHVNERKIKLNFKAAENFGDLHNNCRWILQFVPVNPNKYRNGIKVQREDSILLVNIFKEYRKLLGVSILF